MDKKEEKENESQLKTNIHLQLMTQAITMVNNLLREKGVKHPDLDDIMDFLTRLFNIFTEYNEMYEAELNTEKDNNLEEIKDKIEEKFDELNDKLPDNIPEPYIKYLQKYKRTPETKDEHWVDEFKDAILNDKKIYPIHKVIRDKFPKKIYRTSTISNGKPTKTYQWGNFAIKQLSSNNVSVQHLSSKKIMKSISLSAR
jgi:hypothetical protein